MMKYLIVGIIVLLIWWFYRKELAALNEDTKNPAKKGRNFKSIGEELCTEILEKHLQREVLNNVRPDFLVNPKTKRKMELDVFDPQTNVAIEYNGIQHYKFPNKFHKSKEEFEAQQYRDDLKCKICKKVGINLISIPYTIDDGISNKEMRREVLRQYILSHLV